MSTILCKSHETYIGQSLPSEVYIGPVEFKLPQVGIRYDEVVLIVDIEDYLGSIQILDRHVFEGEVERLLPDGIVGLFADLSRINNTGVFLV